MLGLHELKQRLQGFFTDGLVTIVGSGLSCAEGLPGMSQLALDLKGQISGTYPPEVMAQWQEILAKLDKGNDLETAISVSHLDSTLEADIIDVVAKSLRDAEERVVRECIRECRKLKISHILPFLSPKQPKKIQIITTNYDRLIEIAGEIAGFWVDTGFCGRISGVFNPSTSKVQGAIGIGTSVKRTPKLLYPNCISLFKPHGSLDWYSASDSSPICTTICASNKPLIITPGQHKYRLGYEQPFDEHRNQGNTAIDNGSSFLFIGYGFNDDHLQTHLETRIKFGIPGLILTRTLTDNARKIVNLSNNIIALSKNTSKNETLVTMKDAQWNVPDSSWWDVEHFATEVLKP